jgi:DNA-binding NarL/FixJ family response regulator
MTRILIADPDHNTRKALTLLLTHRLGLTDIRQADGWDELTQQMAECPADVLLLADTLPGRAALEAIQGLLAAHPRLKVMLLSLDNGQRTAAQAGGVCFIYKGSPGNEVAECLKCLLDLPD